MHPSEAASRRLAFLLIVPLLFSGCAGVSHHESRGVKLSEAMESSARGDSADLGGSSSHESDFDHDERRYSGGDGGSWLGATYDETDYAWQVPMDAGYSVPFNGAIDGLIHFTLTPIALEDEQNYLGFNLGGAIVHLKSGSLPDLGTKNPWLFESGLTYRRYFNSSRVAFSPYVAVNFGYQLLSWDYRTPIVAGGDTIRSDSLGGLDGSVALGISTRRDNPVSAFGEVGVGATGFFKTTGEGFENDVFDTFGYFSVKAGLTLKF